jgi:AraC-like DNA-binding protein
MSAVDPVTQSLLPIVLDALQATGANVTAIRENVGLEDDLSLSPGTMTRLFEAASHELNHPSPGLILGNAVPAAVRHPIVYLCMSSKTLGEGLQQLARFLPTFTTTGLLTFDTRGDRTTLHFGPPDAESHHESELVAVLLTRLYGWVTGAEIRALEVAFPHRAPADLSEHHRLLGPSVRFSVQGPASMVLRTSDLRRPSIHANPELYSVHEQYARARMGTLATADVLRKVRAVMEADFGRRTLDLERISRRMNTTARTLQRRLRAEGTSFQNVLDAVRRRRILTRISELDLPLKALAHEAGFSTPASFNKAFKRWTGMSPSAYRANLSKAHRD